MNKTFWGIYYSSTKIIEGIENSKVMRELIRPDYNRRINNMLAYLSLATNLIY